MRQVTQGEMLPHAAQSSLTVRNTECMKRGLWCLPSCRTDTSSVVLDMMFRYDIQASKDEREQDAKAVPLSLYYYVILQRHVLRPSPSPIIG